MDLHADAAQRLAVYRGLQARNRVHAIAIALREGFISPPSEKLS